MKKTVKGLIVGLISASLMLGGVGDVAAALQVSTKFCNGAGTLNVDGPNGGVQDVCFQVTNHASETSRIRLSYVDGFKRGWWTICYSDHDSRGRNKGPLYNASTFVVDGEEVKTTTFDLEPGETGTAYGKVQVPASGELVGCMITQAGDPVEGQPGAISVQLRKANMMRVY